MYIIIFQRAEKTEGPRLLKSHMPLPYFKTQPDNNPEVKIIQVTRNPRDTLASYYKFYCMNEQLGAYNGTWNEFFDLIKNKELTHGDYFDHQAQWYSYNKTRNNSLMLNFEEMKLDLKGHVKKLSVFLGKKIPEKVLNIIVHRTTYTNMVKDPMLNPMPENIPFFRKDFMRGGQIGSWKDCFGKEQIEFVDAKCEKILRPVGLTFKYE